MSMKDRVREVRDKYRALKDTWPSIPCLTVEADLDALLAEYKKELEEKYKK